MGQGEGTLGGLGLSPLQLRQRPEVFQVLQGTLPGGIAFQKLEPETRDAGLGLVDPAA